MSEYVIAYTTSFKRDFKKYAKKQKEITLIKECITLLSLGGYKKIPAKMLPHKLTGNYKGYWECHIKPDLLIIWKQEEKPTEKIYLARVGKHSEVFN